jgi:hypothetical protein
VQAERLGAERDLASTTPITQPLSEAEIRALVRSRRRVPRSLAKATPEQRATIYGEMSGVRITVDPDEPGWVTVEASLACVKSCRREDRDHNHTPLGSAPTCGMTGPPPPYDAPVNDAQLHERLAWVDDIEIVGDGPDGPFHVLTDGTVLTIDASLD